MDREVRAKILARLSRGPIDADNHMLTIEGVNGEVVHQTLVRMNERGEIGVYGASNGDSEFGVDPEIFYRKI